RPGDRRVLVEPPPVARALLQEDLEGDRVVAFPLRVDLHERRCQPLLLFPPFHPALISRTELDELPFRPVPAQSALVLAEDDEFQVVMRSGDLPQEEVQRPAASEEPRSLEAGEQRMELERPREGARQRLIPPGGPPGILHGYTSLRSSRLCGSIPSSSSSSRTMGGCRWQKRREGVYLRMSAPWTSSFPSCPSPASCGRRSASACCRRPLPASGSPRPSPTSTWTSPANWARPSTGRLPTHSTRTRWSGSGSLRRRPSPARCRERVSTRKRSSPRTARPSCGRSSRTSRGRAGWLARRWRAGRRRSSASNRAWLASPPPITRPALAWRWPAA